MRALRDDRGFTMIELMVSVFISILVVGALSLLFVDSNDSSVASQRLLSRYSILEQQMERIRETVKQYGFGALALSTAPSAGVNSPLAVDPTNPNDFISGTGCSQAFTVESNYNSTMEAVVPALPKVADNPEPLLVNGCTVSGTAVTGGQLAAVQCADLTTGTTYADPLSAGAYPACSSVITAGDPYATVDTFVTQTTTAGCNTALGSCAADVRRVILAVVLSAEGADIGANYPAYATTIFANPVASNQTNTASGLKLLGVIP